EHIAALNKFDQLANDPELYFSMQLEPGDMQFVYNHTQLHDRTGFEDWTEEGKQRLLLRLWLSVPGDRPLPPCFRERYGSIEIGNRGGIITRST
ncbi:MAG: TauD/TfdA family dioxygenase, partial [Woeseiales bacterium]